MFLGRERNGLYFITKYFFELGSLGLTLPPHSSHPHAGVSLVALARPVLGSQSVLDLRHHQRDDGLHSSLSPCHVRYEDTQSRDIFLTLFLHRVQVCISVCVSICKQLGKMKFYSKNILHSLTMFFFPKINKKVLC